jgi:hypothetical protein
VPPLPLLLPAKKRRGDSCFDDADHADDDDDADHADDHADDDDDDDADDESAGVARTARTELHQRPSTVRQQEIHV